MSFYDDMKRTLFYDDIKWTFFYDDIKKTKTNLQSLIR
jgi:hypothetical protein